MTEIPTQPVLFRGDRLVGAAVDCPSGGFAVVQQRDGNVVVYATSDGRPVWNAATNGRAVGGCLELRADGKLVVLDADGRVTWSPAAPVPAADRLELGDDGVLALVASGRGRVWTSHEPDPGPWPEWVNRSRPDVLERGRTLRLASLRSPSGEYAFTVEVDGIARLVRRSTAECLFEMGPDRPLAGLALSDDGCLGWRDRHGHVAWDPALTVVPDGERAGELRVTDAGEVRLTTETGALLWSSTRIAEARRTRAAAADDRLAPEDTPLVRTSFGDDPAWTLLVNELSTENEDGFRAYLAPVSDDVYSGRTADQLASSVPVGTHDLLVVADDLTFDTPDRQLLIVEVAAAEASLEPVRTFRAVPSAVQAIENNLSLANADWEDFADDVDADGVYRGV